MRSLAKLKKKISKVKLLKGGKYERREILESLALCGILETEKRKGFYAQYVDKWTREQHGRTGDWGYPLRWWRGKDGINNNALHFWFGRK